MSLLLGQMKPDAYSALPDTLLDNEGYPTEAWLKYLKYYEADQSLPILTFVRDILPDGWWMSDWGFKLHRKYRGKRKLELHTGGWSGNEMVIAAIRENILLTNFKMKYVKWVRGGHHYFEVRD